MSDWQVGFLLERSRDTTHTTTTHLLCTLVWNYSIEVSQHSFLNEKLILQYQLHYIFFYCNMLFTYSPVSWSQPQIHLGSEGVYCKGHQAQHLFWLSSATPWQNMWHLKPFKQLVENTFLANALCVIDSIPQRNRPLDFSHILVPMTLMKRTVIFCSWEYHSIT